MSWNIKLVYSTLLHFQEEKKQTIAKYVEGSGILS